MNKTMISWTHYIYATITASVLAYVTVMDSSKEVDNSAISMLPNINNSDKTEETPEPVEETPEPVEETSEPVEAVPVEASTEPARKSIFGSSRKKLKNNKTKTKTKISKNTKTRRH